MDSSANTPSAGDSFLNAKRSSGILLHVTSLPGRFGIGDFGPSAMRWIDLLADAGQTWWQILPVTPVGRGNSPYGPLSSFALTPLLISPEWLVRDGLISDQDCDGETFSSHFDSGRVDYDAVRPFKQRLLGKAWSNFQSGQAKELKEPFEEFQNENSDWLNDYALFVALKQKFDNKDLLDWPAEYIVRDRTVLNSAREELKDNIDRVSFEQFLLSRQWTELRSHALKRNVKLIGDLPIFVSADSSDVWANSEMFKLDERSRPTVVAGVPPDYFSAEGQLWGNPVYDWKRNQETGYQWWISRLRATLSQVDIVRLDHFRAFAAAWHVAADAENAINGEWVTGPGADFFEQTREALSGLPFVAEDLGLITDDVIELRDQFHLPGMRVLQFAFDGNSQNPFLPANYIANSVAYTGTHDNDTTRGWFDSLNQTQQSDVWNMLGCDQPSSNEVDELLQILWNSDSSLVVAPLQDVLGLGNEARMNVPGTPEGNWEFRCTEEMLGEKPLDRLRELTETSGRRNAN